MLVKLSLLCVLFINGFMYTFSKSENKYTKEANVKQVRLFDEPNGDIRKLEKPFRMAKLNLLWVKSQLRLTEPKLRSLFSELKIHDKEELTFKKIKSEGKDKEGLHEAEIRKKLIGIMSTYGLLEHFEDVNDPSKHKPHKAFSGPVNDKHRNKSLFKDKKLNKLWDKAEASGFTAEELLVLKEEFSHHQDKIDQYYALLEDAADKSKDEHINSIDDELDKFNAIDYVEDGDDKKKYETKLNALRSKHMDIKDGYDKLVMMTASAPDNKDFVEPKVQGLWRLALNTSFTPSELDSLKIELLHYEKRLLKLRHLQVEAALHEKQGKRVAGDKLKVADFVDDSIKKQARKVEKLHLDLETRIMQKHVEL